MSLGYVVSGVINMFKRMLRINIRKRGDKKDNYFASYLIAKMNYKIEDNTLWITDHRNVLIDFDLNEYDVEIFTYKER